MDRDWMDLMLVIYDLSEDQDASKTEGIERDRDKY